MPTPGWNVEEVGAREAMTLLPHDAQGRVDWHEIAVAHLDTGYTPHPVFRLPAPDRGSWVLIERGRNFMEPHTDLPRDPLDYFDPNEQPAHGTRTLSALSAGLSGQLVGVAPGLPVIPYRVTNTVLLDSSRRSRLNLAEAIRHAVDRNHCDVISISLGQGFSASREVGEAIDHAYRQGVVVCCAAGQEFEHVTYPGRHARAIACGGVTPRGKIWRDYNNGRERIAVWAPADDVVRVDTVRRADGAEEYKDPAVGDGTSYATVHVAAAAAMWLARNWSELERDFRGWRRVEAFRAQLKATGRKLRGNEHPFKKDADLPENGTGRLDIPALLRRKLSDLPPLAEAMDAAGDDAR
jgi:hypothetical protein